MCSVYATIPFLLSAYRLSRPSIHTLVNHTGRVLIDENNVAPTGVRNGRFPYVAAGCSMEYFLTTAPPKLKKQNLWLPF